KHILTAFANGGRDRDLDGKLTPRPIERRQLEPLIDDRRLARLEKPLEPTGVRLAILFGDDQVRQAASEDLRARPAERALGLRVPADDQPGFVDADERIVRSVDDQ